MKREEVEIHSRNSTRLARMKVIRVLRMGKGLTITATQKLLRSCMGREESLLSVLVDEYGQQFAFTEEELQEEAQRQKLEETETSTRATIEGLWQEVTKKPDTHVDPANEDPATADLASSRNLPPVTAGHSVPAQSTPADAPTESAKADTREAADIDAPAKVPQETVLNAGAGSSVTATGAITTAPTGGVPVSASTNSLPTAVPTGATSATTDAALVKGDGTESVTAPSALPGKKAPSAPPAKKSPPVPAATPVAGADAEEEEYEEEEGEEEEEDQEGYYDEDGNYYYYEEGEEEEGVEEEAA
eukprot:GFYU01020431.1.p1 GENE.GFYU01020431.1~~GFYU01020431.1.p1  ORF type:complete len:303 (-),score=39.48 GFYU01020431.1:49-957(-)